MATLILEVSQGGRHDPQFHRVEKFPLTIGRAYDNDIILLDETVSPHHLQVEQNEEGYCARNLSAENGTWSGDHQFGETPEKLQPPATLRLGRTQIKLLAIDTPVAPTRTFPHASWLTRWASDLRVAIGILGVYLMLSISFALERQSSWLNWERVLVNQLLEIALPLLAATAIGFISRLLLHRWRFALQLSIACLALGVLNFSDYFIELVSYWFTNYQVADYIATVIMVISFGVLLTWQLRAVSTLSRRRAAWTSFAIVVPLFLILELQAIINKPAFEVAAPMHTLLKPGDVRIAKNFKSIDEFRQQVEQTLEAGLTEELAKDQNDDQEGADNT